MAQTRLLELVVGLFVCLGLAALFLLTLQVSTANGLSGSDSYRVSARFANIGGLSTRAPVAMAGVDIGRVEAITLDEKSFEAIVTLAIDNRYDELPADSSAKILTAGLLGEQYIGIVPGGSLDNLQPGDEITFTQGALVLENLIGQFVANMQREE